MNLCWSSSSESSWIQSGSWPSLALSCGMPGKEVDNAGTFFFQSGCYRQPRALPTIKSGEQPGTMEMMYNRAAAFLDFYYPHHAYVNIHNRISLFLLDDNGLSIGKITEVQQIKHGDTVLVAVTGPPESHPNLLVPHNVHVHSYISPTFCDYCGEMLYGLIRQGLKCQGCGHNFHRRCADKVPNSCPLTKLQSRSSNAHSHRLSINSSSPDFHQFISGDADILPTSSPISSFSFGRPQWIDRAVMEAKSEGKTREHAFAIHNYLQPTVCSHCRKLLIGVFRQGFRCKTCRLNAHKGCLKYMTDVACVPCSGGAASQLSECDVSLSVSMSTSRTSSDLEPDEDVQNIPLQRICMSVRKSKRAAHPEIIFADWMVFCKKEGRDLCIRYWVLDSQGIKIVDSDAPADRGNSECCHSIPLAKIMDVIFTANEKHVFEIVVNDEGTYCIGEAVVSYLKSALAPYCRAAPPEEVLRSHALARGMTFKEILQRALDEKRVSTFYNYLVSAHKPVEGQLFVETSDNTDNAENAASADTADSKPGTLNVPSPADNQATETTGSAPNSLVCPNSPCAARRNKTIPCAEGKPSSIGYCALNRPHAE